MMTDNFQEKSQKIKTITLLFGIFTLTQLSHAQVSEKQRLEALDDDTLIEEAKIESKNLIS